MLARIANREDPGQSDLGLLRLSRPFWQATSVQILGHLPYVMYETLHDRNLQNNLASRLLTFFILNSREDEICSCHKF